MDRLEVFATPIRALSLEDVESARPEIAERLAEEARSTEGLRRSNTGGWHSPPDLGQRTDPCYRRLMQSIVDHAGAAFDDIAAVRTVEIERPRRYGLQAWAMVMGDGDYAVIHDHAEAHLSVVYYADPGDADLQTHPDSGRLCFVDPRRARTSISGLDLFPSEFSVAPSAGLLVVFPGWLQHFVHPYRGSRPRVSVSCNLRIDLG